MRSQASTSSDEEEALGVQTRAMMRTMQAGFAGMAEAMKDGFAQGFIHGIIHGFKHE